MSNFKTKLKAATIGVNHQGPSQNCQIMQTLFGSFSQMHLLRRLPFI